MLTPSIPVIVDRHLCVMEFAGWKRSHKRPRINKKWHKRYGPILRCKGYAYAMLGPHRLDKFLVVGASPYHREKKIICCPCMYAKLAEATEAHERMTVAPILRPIANSTF